MPRLRLRLEYDGSEFCGWQLQDGDRSVQGVVERALGEVLDAAPPRLHGAGRTDAGVHASGQAAHFDADTTLEPAALLRALNARLPDDVSALAVDPVAPEFHARHDALGKRYDYRILNRPEPSPLRRRRCWHVRKPLDLDAMRSAASAALGTRDFAAFRGAPGGAGEGETTRRTLDRLEVDKRGDECLIRAEGRSFLRYMVRNLVGTLVEIGRDQRRAAEMARILESGDRARAGVTAPAHGLCLAWVDYADDRQLS